MKDLTKVFIDLSKCTEEQRKHIFSLLPKKQYKKQYKINEYHFILQWIGVWDVVNDDYEHKTELTYPEFIKLFEGGEKEASDPTAQLKADKEELQNWKDSAMEVMNDLNLQEIGKILKLELGTSVSKQLFSKVSELVADKEELLEALESVKLYGKPICNDSGDGIIIDFETMYEIESLIQKHKQ